MTRRLTISGSHSEMGLLAEPQLLPDPESPPPSWSPAKYDIWRKPSKIQICMPRLKFMAKVVAGFILLIVMFKVLGTQPPPPPAAPPPPNAPESPEDEFKEPSEKDMVEWAKQEQWVWKNFDRYVIHILPPIRITDTFLTGTKA